MTEFWTSLLMSQMLSHLPFETAVSAASFVRLDRSIETRKVKTASDKLTPTAGDRLSLHSCFGKDASVILSIFTPPMCLDWTAHLFSNLCQMFYVLMSMRRAEASIKHTSHILINYVFSRLVNLSNLFLPPENKSISEPTESRSGKPGVITEREAGYALNRSVSR